MDSSLTLIALIPSILSCAVSIFYAILEYKKQKESEKDEVWETATKMICSNGGDVYSEDFAELYIELKFFKENQALIQKHRTIRKAMDAKEKESISQ